MDRLILADTERREIKALLNVSMDIDLNETKDFELSVHRSAWDDTYQYGGYIFKPGTEIGGRIGRLNTDTALETVKVCGLTWRGMLNRKVIEPPAGRLRRVSGELHEVMKELSGPEFEGLFLVSEAVLG